MSAEQPFAGVCPAVEQALITRGFTGLTAVQQAVLDPELSGKNLRISSRTGSGKTVAIGLALAPSLAEALAAGQANSGPLALVIAPTRELAAQVRGELDWLYADLPNFRSAVVTGGTDIVREKRVLARRPSVLVATPGRLLDHINSGNLDCGSLLHVVLDEADQMLDLGFRDELDAIVETLPEGRRSHLVSATFAANVRRLAKRFQGDAVEIEAAGQGEAHEDIEHVGHLVERHQRFEALVNCLLMADGARCLVFVKRRCDAAELSERLAGDGFSVLPLSGDLPQGQRTRTLNAFRHGIVKTLIATDVAARGIDVADISTVIHYDLPEDDESHTHRSGRTGRAGQKGRSVLLVSPHQQRRVERALASMKIELSWSAPPSAARIQKSVVKRARRAMYELLGTPETVDEKSLEYARELLSEQDPAHLVATLLKLSEPRLPREPFVVESAKASKARGGPAPSGPRSFSNFSINWGHGQGATPARMVAHICRRSGISSRHIGAVDIGRELTRFEIDSAVAKDFESRAAEPDSRDPHLLIEPSQQGPKPQRGRGGRPGDDRGRGFQQRRGEAGPSGRRGSRGPGGPRGGGGGRGFARSARGR